MKLCVMPGDGIGQEVVPVAVAALQRLLPELEVHTADAGWDCFVRTGQALPATSLAQAQACGAVLFGAVSSPARKVDGYRSPIVALRRALNAYANVRPTTPLPIAGARQEVNLLIVRENTEDLYIGEEQRDGDTATAIKRITAGASRRVARAACEVMRAQGLTRLTVVHKANILKSTSGLFLRTAPEGLGRAFPDRRIVQKGLEFLLGLALKIVPVGVIFAHMVLAEPEIVVEVARILWRTVLTGLVAALFVAAPRRGLERAGHTASALGPAFFIRGRGDVESERVAVAHLPALS